MKNLHQVLLGLFLATACVTVSAADRDVSAYYYPWYDRPNNSHWQQGTLRTRLVPPSPPELGFYSSRNQQVIRRHLEWSESYGIDNWICSWWGSDSFEDRTLLRSILPTIADRRTKFCIYYESQGLLPFDHETETIVFDAKVAAKFVRDVRYLARTYFEHPNYQRIEGRPVLHLYLSRCFEGDYARAISAARDAVRALGYDVYLVGDEIFWGTPNADRIGRMDAITTYSMHGPPDFNGYPGSTEWLKHMSNKFNEYSSLAAKQGVSVIPNVMPGFNNRGSGGNLYAIPRQLAPGEDETSTFRSMVLWAEKYIDPKLNAVCVTSFNEWHEDTQIEPTIVTSSTDEDDTGERMITSGYRYQGYGTEYLKLVRELMGTPIPVERDR